MLTHGCYVIKVLAEIVFCEDFTLKFLFDEGRWIGPLERDTIQES